MNAPHDPAGDLPAEYTLARAALVRMILRLPESCAADTARALHQRLWAMNAAERRTVAELTARLAAAAADVAGSPATVGPTPPPHPVDIVRALRAGHLDPATLLTDIAHNADWTDLAGRLDAAELPEATAETVAALLHRLAEAVTPTAARRTD